MKEGLWEVEMEYVPLGSSDLLVSRLCFGGCPLGGHGWGEGNDDKLKEAISFAVSEGINFFDTADTYGLGKSEQLLGEVLKEKRSEVILATKFGVRQNAKAQTFYDNSPEWISKALEGSLKRLKTDTIDLYQLHYWDQKTPFDLILEVLEQKRKEGKIRFFGVTNVNILDLHLKKIPEGLVSFSFEYSLAHRKWERVIQQHWQQWNMGFLSWGSLGQGVLSGKYDQKTVFSKNDRRSRMIYSNFHGEKLQQNLQIIECMKEILPYYLSGTFSQMALRWILDWLKGSVVLAGMKNKAQVLDNLGSFHWNLSESHLSRLHQISRELGTEQNRNGFSSLSLSS